MKRILTLLLASVMLFAALPAAFAQPDAEGLSLDPMSALKINAESGYIENLPTFMTVSEIVSNFTDRKDISVTNAKGEALSLSDVAGTDAVITKGDSSAKVLVHGDVDRDAKINIKDALAIVKTIAGVEVDMVKEAADVTYDGKSNVQDAMAILKLIAGWDVDLRNPAGIGKLSADKEDADIELLFDNVMHRVGVSNVDPSDDYTYTVRMAKNEIESLQIFLTTTADKKGMSLEIGDIVNANGKVLETEQRYQYYYKFEMFNELYSNIITNTTSDKYGDPLPKLVNPFDLTANESKGFVVKIKTKADTEAGLYKSTVNLKDADGNVVKTAEFRVYVWNFTLDETPATATAFGLGSYDINMSDGEPEYIDPDGIIAKYKKYYDYLLENGMSAYAMPYEITDPRADEYLNDPRVTAVCTWQRAEGYGGAYYKTDEQLVKIYEKLETNPEWLEKAYLYPVDEPYSMSGMNIVKDVCEHLMSVLPNYKNYNSVIPLTKNQFFYNESFDTVEFVSQYVNILCPQSNGMKRYVPYADIKKDPDAYPPGYAKEDWEERLGVKYYGSSFIDRLPSFLDEGYKIWWYVCIGPGFPYPNFFQSYQGVNTRVVLWQQYMYNIDGLLYYATNNWEGVTKGKTNNGDGLLLYRGSMFGEDVGPVPSIRMESVRDGIEDFQYLTQLENIADRDTAMTFVDRVTTHLLEYSEDYRDMVAVRTDLGFALEALYEAK